MKVSRFKFVPILVLFGAATGGAITLISVRDEIEIGRQAQEQVKSQVPELGDETVVSYVAGVGRQLAARTTGPKYPYSFSVANYREINAFALPGGPVWLHRGAIEAATNESQLAGVLAHEVAHIAKRHAAEQISKGLLANGLLGLLGAVLGDDRGGRVAGVLAQVAVGGYMLKFSRDDEREADEVGVQIMRRAGWDAHGMLEFMPTLRAQQGRDPGSVAVFLSTHPSPAERVTRLQRLAGSGRSGRRDSAGFRTARARLDRLPPAQRMPQR